MTRSSEPYILEMTHHTGLFPVTDHTAQVAQKPLTHRHGFGDQHVVPPELQHRILLAVKGRDLQQGEGNQSRNRHVGSCRAIFLTRQ